MGTFNEVSGTGGAFAPCIAAPSKPAESISLTEINAGFDMAVCLRAGTLTQTKTLSRTKKVYLLPLAQKVHDFETFEIVHTCVGGVASPTVWTEKLVIFGCFIECASLVMVVSVQMVSEDSACVYCSSCDVFIYQRIHTIVEIKPEAHCSQK
jgi:hypothetical protein